MVSSTQNRLSIQFISDYSDAYDGFRLEWTTYGNLSSYTLDIYYIYIILYIHYIIYYRDVY